MKKRALSRSEMMRRIRSKNTSPEMAVRSFIFKSGFRYRVHVKKLPGKPDIVFPKQKKVIFVHGCFWHLHTCVDGRIPKTNVDMWKNKLEKNIYRDELNLTKLDNDGWLTLIVWECEIEKNFPEIQKRILFFLKKQT